MTHDTPPPASCSARLTNTTPRLTGPLDAPSTSSRHHQRSSRALWSTLRSPGLTAARTTCNSRAPPALRPSRGTHRPIVRAPTRLSVPASRPAPTPSPYTIRTALRRTPHALTPAPRPFRAARPRIDVLHHPGLSTPFARQSDRGKPSNRPVSSSNAAVQPPRVPASPQPRITSVPRRALTHRSLTPCQPFKPRRTRIGPLETKLQANLAAEHCRAAAS
jgi:hypothetical protein